MQTNSSKGTLYVFAAPSGAGKTSLVKALLERLPGVVVSVSHTTRDPRPGEQDGSDYHFIDKGEFERLVRQGEFLEHARVFDNYYGTHRATVLERLAADEDVILEIDWQGAQQVRAAMPDCVTVFILPPSRDELERRLRSRGTDSEAVIERRLRDALSDMSHWDEFDHVIINDDLDEAVLALEAVIRGEGASSAVGNPDLAERVKNILV